MATGSYFMIFKSNSNYIISKEDKEKFLKFKIEKFKNDFGFSSLKDEEAFKQFSNYIEFDLDKNEWISKHKDNNLIYTKVFESNNFCSDFLVLKEYFNCFQEAIVLHFNTVVQMKQAIDYLIHKKLHSKELEFILDNPFIDNFKELENYYLKRLNYILTTYICFINENSDDENDYTLVYYCW